MGGTTAKACLIEGGEPLTSGEFEVARVYRFKKGSGLPVKTSVIEMIEIGAGGGSIAGVGPLGLPKVGPRSAGSSPGPACYGRGGDEPTVTDADLILGYLDPDFFLGGKMRLDREAALRAVEEMIARPLGLHPTEAAWGTNSRCQAGVRTTSLCSRKACASSCQTARGYVASVRGRKAGESKIGSTSAGGRMDRV